MHQVRTDAPKRNFSQTVDLLIKFQNINPKKQEQKVDVFVVLPQGIGRKASVCALVGDALYTDAKEFCDHTIVQDEFKALAGNAKALKRLARTYDYFLAQADIMPAIATTFGRFLGPKGKMPNPKAGAVVPAKGSTKPVVEKLQKTVRFIAKGTELAVRGPVGKEAMGDDAIAENVITVYNALVTVLPEHERNIKQVLLKLTMSKAVIVGGKK